MSRSLKVRPEYISQVKLAVKRNGYARQKDLAEELFISLSTLNNYLNGRPVDHLNFTEISDKLGQDWKEISTFEDNPTSTIGKENPEEPIPGCPEENASSMYVERPPIEQTCLEALLRPHALVRVKAPRLMGKTSLMVRMLAQLAQKGYKRACLNLHLATETDLTAVNRFFKWFCISVGQSLGMPNRLADYWDEDFSTSKVDTTEYFEKYLLPNAGAPVVLCLDEVDRVFPYREVASEFLGLLRAWHERGKVEKIWQGLRLVVVHSTEVYIPLNINESPFNVGLPIELPEFTPEQVQELARQHGKEWNPPCIEQLMEMVGGHPYLVEQAFINSNDSLESLLQDAPTDAGIYANHLRHLWRILRQHSDLTAALLKVVEAENPVRLELMQTYKLHSMGLIKKQGNEVMPSCRLYQQYFRERLGEL
ncbi:AAA-like domain-containing protein [Lusitaniella coriacea LEGE 07157]|uniref:AAA-like domain-containing protein n=1 Tax=Lusitaniella coriacea LEGE 07157 TaxID=945747 RepID=A0A8J7J6L4_9CYAN|nr:AAA-like domain-containing protein [Lusitaniella coriacea]MBE9118774.1 AAA-like domain-containing protein [Lusitaniella coriacea LEGE 07157]